MTLIERRWECQHCTVTAVSCTEPGRPATPHHTCRGMAGLLIPMVPEGFKGRLIAHEREDFIGKELVQVDGHGRPIMNITVERPDGSNDVTVYAPAATASQQEG